MIINESEGRSSQLLDYHEDQEITSPESLIKDAINPQVNITVLLYTILVMSIKLIIALYGALIYIEPAEDLSRREHQTKPFLWVGTTGSYVTNIISIYSGLTEGWGHINKLWQNTSKNNIKRKRKFMSLLQLTFMKLPIAILSAYPIGILGRNQPFFSNQLSVSSQTFIYTLLHWNTIPKQILPNHYMRSNENANEILKKKIITVNSYIIDNIHSDEANEFNSFINAYKEVDHQKWLKAYFNIAQHVQEANSKKCFFIHLIKRRLSII